MESDRTRVLAGQAVMAELDGRFDIVESGGSWLVVRRYSDRYGVHQDAVALLRPAH